MISVQILNSSTLISNDRLAPIVAALQIQLERDFGPAYGIEAQVTLKTMDDRGSWPIYVFDTDTDAPPGALAWHSADNRGRPYGMIPMKTILDYNEDPAPPIGHELLEMLADPLCSRIAYAHYPPSRKFRRTAEIAYEVCDACEEDSYHINGIAMTNFVLESWFIESSAGPCDHLGKLPRPLTLDRGGYMQWSTDGHHWNQVQAEKTLVFKDRKVKPGYHSRLHRRRRNSVEMYAKGHHANIARLETAVRAKNDPAMLRDLIDSLTQNIAPIAPSFVDHWISQL